MKSLYNEYEAQIPECDPIDQIMQDAVNAVVAYCKENDFSLRDALGVCTMTLNGNFAYHTLKNAIEKQKAERESTK